MGICVSKKSEQSLDYCTRIELENAELKQAVAKLTLKIENYGMMLSGNAPQRLTPTAYEVSKRVGSFTI